uniref:Uncharacterized protein n=1 Tax=Meloidogyne floridensis TaxID=298350 RepID=A0A915PEF4_9BILA
MIQKYLLNLEPYTVHINVNLTIDSLEKWFDLGPGAPISTNLQLSAIRQQFYTEWMCDAGSKMLDYLKVETNKRECTERIEPGYKDLAKIFVESVSIDYSEDNIVEELSKLKKDNTEYKNIVDDFDKWYDAGHIREANLNLTGKNIMPFQNDKGMS